MRSSAGILHLTALILASGSAASFAPAPVDDRLDEVENMIEDGWWSDAGKELAGGNSERAHYTSVDIESLQ